MRSFKSIIRLLTTLTQLFVELITWYLFLKVKLKVKYHYNLLKLNYVLTRRKIPRELRDFIVKTYREQYKHLTSFSLRRVLKRTNITKPTMSK